jgi:hypothetical protein
MQRARYEAAMKHDRAMRTLLTLTLTTADEAEALRATCPLAVDALVRQLAAGDRTWWQWVENRLAEIRHESEEGHG